MNIPDLVDSAFSEGVLMRFDGSKVTVDGPPKAIAKWSSRIAANETELVKYLQAADRQQTTPDEGVKIIAFDELSASYPSLRPPIIDGLFRAGEVCNVIASPKVGKSHLVGQLAWSIITGADFLGFTVSRQGSVLIVDNELHRETLAHRHRTLCDALAIDDAYRQELHVMPLRGVLCDVVWLRKHLAGIQPGQYACIVLDAFYKILPVGISENDNASMAQVYAGLDSIAAELDCAVICVHHSSKGDQGGKQVTDVGSGAGSISRAVDTHIVIRAHAEENLCVLEAVTRSFRRPDPITVEMSYPLWQRSGEPPVVRNQAAAGRQARQQQQEESKQSSDIADVNKLLALIGPKPIAKSALRTKSGWGNNKFDRILSLAEHTWKAVKVSGYRKKGQTLRRYRVERLHLCVENALKQMPQVESWNPNRSNLGPVLGPVLGPD